jgi:hypothetical protein
MCHLAMPGLLPTNRTASHCLGSILLEMRPHSISDHSTVYEKGSFLLQLQKSNVRASGPAGAARANWPSKEADRPLSRWP